MQIFINLDNVFWTFLFFSNFELDRQFEEQNMPETVLKE